MTRKIAITTLSVLLIFLNILSAWAEKKNSKRIPLQKTIELNYLAATSNNKNNDYYSSIISHTLAQKLKKSSSLAIKETKKVKKPEKNYFTAKNIKNYRQKGIDYIIIGNYTVETAPGNDIVKEKIKNLFITITVLNIEGREKEDISITSREQKIFLRQSIDDLSEKIIVQIQEFERKNKKRFSELYRPSAAFTFGMKYGRIYLIGNLSNVYNHTELVSPFILINPKQALGGHLGFSANFEYFATDNEDKNIMNATFLEFWAVTGQLHIIFRAGQYSSFSIAAGGGYSRSKEIIYISYMGPGSPKLDEPVSYDPYAVSEISFNLELNPVFISAGIAYKRVFYQKESLDMMVLFGGMGFTF